MIEQFAQLKSLHQEGAFGTQSKAETLTHRLQQILSEEIADAASEHEQAITQIGLVLREIAVKLSKDDAHTMLLILSSCIRENEVMYDPKMYDPIQSEGRSIESLFNAVYKL